MGNCQQDWYAKPCELHIIQFKAMPLQDGISEPKRVPRYHRRARARDRWAKTVQIRQRDAPPEKGTAPKADGPSQNQLHQKLREPQCGYARKSQKPGFCHTKKSQRLWFCHTRTLGSDTSPTEAV